MFSENCTFHMSFVVRKYFMQSCLLGGGGGNNVWMVVQLLTMLKASLLWKNYSKTKSQEFSGCQQHPAMPDLNQAQQHDKWIQPQTLGNVHSNQITTGEGNIAGGGSKAGGANIVATNWHPIERLCEKQDSRLKTIGVELNNQQLFHFTTLIPQSSPLGLYPSRVHTCKPLSQV